MLLKIPATRTPKGALKFVALIIKILSCNKNFFFHGLRSKLPQLFYFIISGSARGKPFYEQHFIVSGGIDCKLKATIYTRVTDRRVLNWIQRNTETAPLLMVVGGFSSKKANGVINDIELISTKKSNLCSKHVKPIFGRRFNQDGVIQNEYDALGMTKVKQY
jgi:hypothetical protein